MYDLVAIDFAPLGSSSGESHCEQEKEGRLTEIVLDFAMEIHNLLQSFLSLETLRLLQLIY